MGSLLDRLISGRDDAVVRRGGETFVTPALAMDVIDRAAALGVKPLGLEGFLVSEEAVYPALSQIADASNVEAAQAVDWLLHLLSDSWADAPRPGDQLHAEAHGRHLVTLVLAEPVHHARFFFDFGSGRCVWGADDVTRAVWGYAIDPADLPIRRSTAAMLDELCADYDIALNWSSPADPGPWREEECERFNRKAADALRLVEEELGDSWSIRDEFEPVREDPDLDRYLADPAGFRRTSPPRRAT